MLKTKVTKWAAAAAMVLPLSASAQLLGVVPQAPNFDYNNGGVVNFDATTGNLVVNASPTFWTEDGVTDTQIFAILTSPSVTMSVFVDTNCVLTNGDPSSDDLVVMGDIDSNFDFVPEYSGTLLTAEITDLGSLAADPVVGTANYDAKFVVTGGVLVDAGIYAVGDKVGMTITSEASNFNGACDVDHNGGSKGEIGIIPSDPEPEKCYDVKKVWVQDANAYAQCYGWGGSYYGSKFKVKVAAECESDFDPTNDLISVSLDGETFEFTPGSFVQDFDNTSRFEASVSGRPTLRASLDCREGWFSIKGYKADVSQVTFIDGIDVGLVLGSWSKVMNAPVTPGKTYNGFNLTWKYWNSNPADCSNPDYEPPACVTAWDAVKFKHIDSGEYFTLDAEEIGSVITLEHNYVDNGASCSAMAEVDSSCSTAVTCGDVINGYKVMRIEHKDDHQSCDVTSHYDSYHHSGWKRKWRW